MSTDAGRIYQFGPFRFDAHSRLLTRDGLQAPLRPKAADLLLTFLESGGQVITKDDLLGKVWPDTSVAESSLTFQINQLRQSLGDGIDGQRYIETLPRRGYRFLVHVSEPAPNGDDDDPHRSTPRAMPMDEPSPARDHSMANLSAASYARAAWRVFSAGAIVVLGIVVLILRTKASDSPQVVRYTRLTYDGQAKDLTPLLTDGSRVYFRRYPDRGAARAVSVAGGATFQLTQLPEGYRLLDVSAARSEFLAARLSDHTLWVVPAFGGSPQRVGEIVCSTATWSPDGERIAYTFDRDVRVANNDGTGIRTLATLPGAPDWPRWSPDGRVLRLSVSDREDEHAIWEVQTDGSGKRPWSAGSTTSPHVCCGDWSPDGRYFFFRSGRGLKGDLWVVREPRGVFDRATPATPLTTPGLSNFFGFVPSKDGKQLFAAAVQEHGELVRYDARLNGFVPYLGGKSAMWVTFSRDGQSVAFAKYPDHTLWRARADGGEERQLTVPPLLVDGISWSPDGRSIAFSGRLGEDRRRDIYIIPADGGTPRRLLTRDKDQGIPTWSADGRIAFSDVPKRFGVARGDEVIHIYDLSRRQLSDVIGSDGLYTCRWSPDGRYMVAVTIRDPQKLMLFDFVMNKWRSLGAEHIENATWSRDSRYVYYGTNGIESGVLWRVRITDGGIDRLAEHATTMYWWRGLALDDSPIILRNIGSVEIYSLDLKLP